MKNANVKQSIETKLRNRPQPFWEKNVEFLGIIIVCDAFLTIGPYEIIRSLRTDEDDIVYYKDTKIYPVELYREYENDVDDDIDHIKDYLDHDESNEGEMDFASCSLEECMY
jgi:hypothetical protein